jgi:integrase
MYRRAVELLILFLEESPVARALSLAGPNAAERSLTLLGSNPQDANLLIWFVSYLGRERTMPKSRRGQARESLRLQPATVHLYGQAMVTWFKFLADEMLLPARFPAPAAIARAQRSLRTYVPSYQARDGAPEPPQGMETLVHAFDSRVIPESLPFKEQQRRKLEALRNKAILYALADSGARVSEVLRLTADDVRGAQVNEQGIWQVQVRDKGRGTTGRQITIRFTAPTLLTMKEYLETRRDPGATALFVSHAKTRPEYRGLPLSPNAVWDMIQRAARELGLPHIHPHDFRHWRATQMLRQGVPIDQVQRFLNHRSIQTTQLYAKTAEVQVDQAGARTSPIVDE